MRDEGETADAHAMRYLLPLLLLVGCVSTHRAWRNGNGNHGFKTDWYECERDARVTSQRRHGDATVHVDEEFRQRCMWAKGWEEFEQPDELPQVAAVDAGT